MNIIAIGDSGVGKQAIIKRMSEQNGIGSDSHLQTAGLDFILINYTAKDGTKVKVKFWDTAGQERFRTITASFYRKADGVLLVYDVDNLKSFENIESWIE